MWGSAGEGLPVIAEHSVLAEQPDQTSLASAAKHINTLPPGYKADSFDSAPVPEAPLASEVGVSVTGKTCDVTSDIFARQCRAVKNSNVPVGV